MRNDPRHIFPRRVLVEVGQGVDIGIEPIRCNIGSITAGENSKVDHRERLLTFKREEIRGFHLFDPRFFILRRPIQRAADINVVPFLKDLRLLCGIFDPHGAE